MISYTGYLAEIDEGRSELPAPELAKRYWGFHRCEAPLCSGWSFALMRRTIGR